MRFMSIEFQTKIYKNFRAGCNHTKKGKYIYTIEYNPMAFTSTWIIRRPAAGGVWDWHQPLDLSIN